MASCSIRDPTKLHIRNFSCFCAFCLDEDYENCISSQHVGDWHIHLLVPTNLTYIQSLVEATNDEMDGNMEAMEKILYNHWKLETILLSTQLQVMKRNVSFMLLQETDL